MSLLSRFRRTVLPSTSSNKKHSTDVGRQYNYRKPTKSFNEKSVKSRSLQAHLDAHDDINYQNYQQHHHHNAKEKPTRNNSKISKSSTLTNNNKSTKTKTNESPDNANLSRSNTFTLEDEHNFHNETYPRSKKKEKTPNGSSNSGVDFDTRRKNGVNKDVFETFYLKRTPKSSHSSKSSNDSIRGVDDLASFPSRGKPIFTSNGKLHSSFNGKSASIQTNKSTTPRQYLFGLTFDRKAKDEPEKENIYTNNTNINTNTTNANNNTNNNNNNNNNNHNNNNNFNSNSDRFKTITINNLRRSFRDSFLDSAKPAKGREHQQLWFINVNDQREKITTNTKDDLEKSTKASNSQLIHSDDDDDDIYKDDTDSNKYGKSTRRVTRTETFRVDTNDIGNRHPSQNSTYSTNNRPLNGKPIAVTAPYIASNDTDYHSKLSNREYYDGSSRINNHRYDSEHEDIPQHYRHTSDELYSSTSRDNSPIRNDRLNRFNSNPSTRTVIEIKTPTNDDIIYNNSNKHHNNHNVCNKRAVFENRTIPERQSFSNLNATFERPRANRSFASLRAKPESNGLNSRYKYNTYDYDTFDGGEKRYNNLYESTSALRPPKQSEPWRSISSRQFGTETSSNRSFVPYRSTFDRYDDHDFASKSNNTNRTTVNIDYDSNASNVKSKYDQASQNTQNHRHAFTIPLTSNTESPAPIKPKSNKNRSVNFPSVECEVRLISPNYNTKPRRKESWCKESKPVNDWTYNKEDIVIKEIVNGTKCTACKHLCTGFEPHLWRKTCLVCKCPRETHAIYQEQVTSVKERLGLKPTTNTSTLDAKQLGYTWIPPGIMAVNTIRQYFESIPDDKVPRINTIGEQYREQQLSYQCPKQDLALNYCNHVESQNKSSYEDFVAGRNEIALDIAYVKEIINEPVTCITCDDDIEQGGLAVIAPKFKDDVLWHPKCFTCSTCDELLVDLTYCVHDDKIYCERHYAELLKPHCNACDELIFSGEYTKAMNQDWHSGHFCCWQCDESLTGQRYVLRDEHPYCIKCYENVFANTCDECNKIIGIDSKEKHWHEACFLCNKRRVSLVDKQFGSKAEKIYCGNCYDSQFASRCDGCGEVFRAGTKKMEYKTRQWHEKCFSCCVCKNPIGTKSFIPKEQEIYCAGCYEEKYATRCIKCNKIITSGGVTYKNDPWHRECFTCTHCSTSLAGQRFTSRDDKPYCAECFGELFAKRCTSCTKPITGIGGTRFISFEDRHWHNDCFICASCKASLVGRGFITDEADIICPECAKARLM